MLAWIAPAPARACDVTVVPTATTMRLDYDPFAFARTVGRFTVELDSRDAQACAVDIALVDAARVGVAEAEVGGSGVVLRFSPGAGDAVAAPTAVPGVWRVTTDPGRRTRLSIEGLVIRDAVATAGEHATDLTLELRDAGSAVARGAQPLRVVLAAVPRAQMNIVGAAGTFGEGASVAQVDFGVFRSNATRRVFLQVRANTGARLTIDSANRGLLLRGDGPAQEQGIPYTAQLAGDAVDLARHWERAIDPPHSVAGASLPLDLILGDIGAHAAGTYGDVLTLEISAL